MLLDFLELSGHLRGSTPFLPFFVNMTGERTFISNLYLTHQIHVINHMRCQNVEKSEIHMVKNKRITYYDVSKCQTCQIGMIIHCKIALKRGPLIVMSSQHATYVCTTSTCIFYITFDCIYDENQQCSHNCYCVVIFEGTVNPYALFNFNIFHYFVTDIYFIVNVLCFFNIHLAVLNLIQ